MIPLFRPWLRAAGLVALLAACVVYLAIYGRIESDPARFMGGQALDLPVDLPDAATGGGLILASISGGNAGLRADASRTLAETLRGLEGIARVRNGSATATPGRLEPLLPYRYHLSPAVSAERFTEDALRRALRERRRELSSVAGAFDRRWLAADPTGELRVLRDMVRPETAPARRHGVWSTADGGRALLVIELEPERTDAASAGAVIERIQQTFAGYPRSADLRLELTGPAAFASEARARIRGEAQWLTAAASVLIAAIMGFAFRSVRVLLLIGIPLLAAILAGATAASLVFGSLHGIALAFGCTLLGVVVDYPLHLFAHRRRGEPAPDAVARIWPTVRLGALTTLLGYSGMALAEVRGLSQLGLFAMSGVVAGALITRHLLPLLLPPSAPTVTARYGLRWLEAEPPRHGVWVLVALAVAGMAVLGLRSDDLWESDLNRLSPIPASAQRLDGELRRSLGVPALRYLALVEADDEQALLRRLEDLAGALGPLVADGVLQRVHHPAQLLPSRETQRRRQAALPDPGILEQRLGRVGGEIGFRKGAFDPFIEAVARARELEPLDLADLSAVGLDRVLAASLLEANGRWWGVVRFEGVREPQALAQWFARNAAEGIRFFDTKERVETALRDFRYDALRHFGLGAALIVGVLSLGLRSVVAGLATAAPPLVGALGAAAALVGWGERLNVFHLASLPLVVGVGLDYALFFRRAGGVRERVRTRRSLLLCAVSTVSVFGLLACSGLTVLASIGTTVTVGAVLAFVLAWLCSGPAAGANHSRAIASD